LVGVFNFPRQLLLDLSVQLRQPQMLP
jgi:hypothetical protein